jgi:hypothetical protein
MMLVSKFSFIPSPLEGEGPATPGMRGPFGHPRNLLKQTPHPSLRATLSLKGRGEKKSKNNHG